jgi:hypothetical protein
VRQTWSAGAATTFARSRTWALGCNADTVSSRVAYSKSPGCLQWLWPSNGVLLLCLPASLHQTSVRTVAVRRFCSACVQQTMAMGHGNGEGPRCPLCRNHIRSVLEDI